MVNSLFSEIVKGLVKNVAVAAVTETAKKAAITAGIVGGTVLIGGGTTAAIVYNKKKNDAARVLHPVDSDEDGKTVLAEDGSTTVSVEPVAEATEETVQSVEAPQAQATSTMPQQEPQPQDVMPGQQAPFVMNPFMNMGPNPAFQMMQNQSIVRAAEEAQPNQEVINDEKSEEVVVQTAEKKDDVITAADVANGNVSNKAKKQAASKAAKKPVVEINQ